MLKEDHKEISRIQMGKGNLMEKELQEAIKEVNLLIDRITPFGADREIYQMEFEAIKVLLAHAQNGGGLQPIKLEELVTLGDKVVNLPTPLAIGKLLSEIAIIYGTVPQGGEKRCKHGAHICLECHAAMKGKENG